MMTGHGAVLEQLRTEPSIYLVESIDFLEDFDLLVDDTWEWIFREQLNGWMQVADSWPAELSCEVFLEWIDCEVTTTIWDMLKSKIKPAF